MRPQRWLGPLLACLLPAAGAAEAPGEALRRAREGLVEAYDAAIAARLEAGDAREARRLREEKRAVLRAVSLRGGQPLALDPKRLGDYVGRYALPEHRVLEVSAEQGRLFVRSPEIDGMAPLLHLGGDTFLRAGSARCYTFRRDEAGKVTDVLRHRRPEPARRLDPARTRTLRVTAFVDGRSRLVLRGDTAQWYHINWDAPGRTEKGHVPTEINATKWLPVWPDHDGGRNHFACCWSSVCRGLEPALPRGPMAVAVDVVRARGEVRIVDLPCPENDYALVIEAYDPQGGAATYVLEIHARDERPRGPQPRDRPAAIPTDGLVLHLPFKGNANDASGKDRHGTVQGATLTEDRFGNAASAYAFSGDGDHIRVALPGEAPREALSVSVWARVGRRGRGGRAAILSQGAANAPGWQLGVSSGRFGWRSRDAGPDLGRAGKIAEGAWSHLAVVVDGERHLLYLDGARLDSRPGALPAAGGAGVTIGCRGWRELGEAGSFAGRIDDVRVYGRALSRGEVLALYHEGGYDHVPLVEAAARGDLARLKRLVAGGAEVDAPRQGGITALFAAAEAGHREAVAFLLARGADPNAVARGGETPSLAAARGGFLEILTLLVAAKADVGAATREGRTALHAAAALGHDGCVKLLLEAGASPVAVDQRGDTPLHRTAAYGHIATADLLLKMGANLRARNGGGEAAEQIARAFHQGGMADHLQRLARGPRETDF